MWGIVIRSFEQFVARPLIELWLVISVHSWRRKLAASDSPHVHARGTDPDRVLVAGDGVATGRGVLTHELGLPGYLARSLSARTGNAADVDIVVTGDMTVGSCRHALSRVDLWRFDIVVLSLGCNEALALTPPAVWRRGLEELLDDVERRAPVATKVFLLSIPHVGINPHFPSWLAGVVDRHAQQLNAVTQEIVARRPHVVVVPVNQDRVYEVEGARVYRRWAEGIAEWITPALDPDRVPIRTTVSSGPSRSPEGFDDLRIAGDEGDLVLESLTRSAREAFGTASAAVTLIRGDTLVMLSASGMEAVPLPLDEAFCSETVRRSALLVVTDARADPLYAHYPIVTGAAAVRFYAGFPIESPDGRRVGVLCVMDPEPRSFSPLEAELLRSLAKFAQDHLWRRVAA